MSSDWTQGYESDLEYLPGFYGDLAPEHLDLVCLVNGLIPPQRLGSFAYCELGSGHGLTTLALAAANPEGDFYAVDFNPAHTARARDMARAAGIDNVACLEESFEVLAEGGPDMPDLDYITMHGVWSWVSPALREAIVRFIDRRLKPGGLVHVSYNSLPGWTGGIPVQFLLHALAGEARGTSDQRLVSALSIILRMGEAESPYLVDNDVVTRVRDHAEKGELTYLSHEYMTPHWAPQFHARVVRDMAAAKLSYAGSAVLPCNFPDLMLKQSQRAIWNDVQDPALRETITDFFNIRSFRSDVFVRGKRPLAPAERDRRLGAVRLGPIRPRDGMSLTVEVPAGKVNLSEQVYAPVLDLLASGPVCVEALVDAAGTPPGARLNPVEVAGLMVGLRAALPMRAGPAAPAPVTLNTLLGRDVLGQTGNNPSVVVLPAMGTGMSCPGIEAAVLSLVCDLGTTEPGPIAEAIWTPIHARGEALLRDGQRIEDPQENLSLLTKQVGGILDSRLGIWRMHGALPPAVA